VEFDNSFEVPLPPDQAWSVLTDIKRIAPCMPGAELTEVVDDKTYKGKISVRLGPVALAFAGLVVFEEMDAANQRARVKAQGSDAKGRGGANAAASFHLETAGAGTKVLVHTDLSLSGSVAQYGRGVGMIQATAAQIMREFADNLKKQLAAEPALPFGSVPGAGLQPVGGQAQAESETAARRKDERPQSAAIVTPSAPAAKPISGLSLMAKVIWAQIKRLFGGGAPT